MNEKDKLRAKLIEDLDSVEEAEELFSAVNRLSDWAVAQPTPWETAGLLQTLQVNLPTTLARPQVFPRERLAWLYWLLLAQIRVVHREIWAGSIFIVALGVFVSLALDWGVWPFIFTAPIVAAVGVTLLYGTVHDPTGEMQLATPVSPRMLLLVRLLLIFSFDLALALSGSLVLALLLPEVTLWTLVVVWLAPMTFLSALAILITILTSTPELGLLVSMMVWVLQSWAGQVSLGLWTLAVPDLSSAAVRPWLWGMALLLGAAAVWLGGREERWLNKEV